MVVASSPLVVESGDVQTTMTTAGTAAANATALTADIAAAHVSGRRIYVPLGDYSLNNVDVVDKHLRIKCHGRLIQQPGQQLLNVRHSLGAARTVTAVSTLIARNPDYTTDFETMSTLTLASADIGDVAQGDLFLISSDNAYTGQYVAGGASTFPCQWVPIGSVGMDVTITGTVAEGDTVVGATSGATAQVLGIWTAYSTAQKTLALGARTGTFTNGETLKVGVTNQATVGALPYLIMAGRLLDTQTTTPKLYKAQTGYETSIDARITTSADADTVVGSANRGDAIELLNIAHADLKVYADNCWARVLKLTSCYMAKARVRVNKAPNAATASEAGFGYGVEVNCATEHCDIEVQARNVRHAFTTNCASYANFAAVDQKRSGVPKWNYVHDSTGAGCINAAFDTHAGAVYTRFENCRAWSVNTGGRTVTAPAGYQNRAFGSEFIDCIDYGSPYGFIEISNQYAAPFLNTTRYINCRADRFQRAGWYFSVVTGSKADALSDYELLNCHANADLRITDTTMAYQVGYLNVSSKVKWVGCTAADMNGAPWRLMEAAGDNTILNCFADYTRGPASASGIRFEGNTPTKVFGYRWAKAAAAPGGALRVPTGITATAVRTDGATCINASSQLLAEVQGTFTAVYAHAAGQELVGSASWTPGSVADATSVTTSVTVTGAAVGDAVTFVSFNQTGQTAGVILTGVVTATNTVGVVLRNQSGSTVTLTVAGTVRVIVRKSL